MFDLEVRRLETITLYELREFLAEILCGMGRLFRPAAVWIASDVD